MRKLSRMVMVLVALLAVACEDDSMQGPSATVDDDVGAGIGDGAVSNDAAALADVATTDDAATATDTAAMDDATAALDAATDTAGTPDSNLTDSQMDSIAADATTPDIAAADLLVSPDTGVVLDAPAALCGNGYCDAGENPQSCANDCKGLSWTCGDGVCDIGEQFYCSNDCSASACGNGKCEPGEGTANCPSDCPAGVAVCGNGKCESGENGSNCSKDCGIGSWQCGDGKCDFGEQFYCQQDCQSTQVDPTQCTQQKCALDYQKCAKSAPCLSAFQCILGCGGKWSCQQACVSSASGTGNDAVQLALCGQQAGCF